MNALQAIALGLIQGLTEFLPVSSSGHLLLGSFVLGLPAPGLSLSILLHLGTAFATVAMLWKEIAWLVSGVFVPKDGNERKRALTIVGLLVLASVPGAVVGLFFSDFIDSVFGSGGVAAVGLIVSGFILRAVGRNPEQVDGTPAASSRRRPSRRPSRRRADADEGSPNPEVLGTLNIRRAVIVGLSQAAAVIPGISRSGSTIASGLLTGMEREDAARFSFLLALPAVFGGAFLDFREAAFLGEPAFSALGLLGAATAFLAGVFALSVVFRVVRRGELSKFAYYCWAAGALSLAWLMVRG